MAYPFGSWRDLLVGENSKKRRKRYGSATQTLLAVEPLEDRRLLAVTSVTLHTDTGTLSIQGSSTSDTVVISEASPNTISVQYARDGIGVVDTFDKAQVQLIKFFGQEGDDRIENLTDISLLAHGGDGHDWLQSGSGADDLRGGAGNDVIVAGGGDDILRGDEGNDNLYGEAGNDAITGGSGNDNIFGGDGADRGFGQEGKDQLDGGVGDDELDGGADEDVLVGGAGNDVLRGGLHNDLLNGQDGNDKLYGEEGDDVLNGEAGDDTLRGDDGDDLLMGGDGADELSGGSARDTLYGDAGNDTLTGGDDDDRMWGGIGDDTLRGQDGDDILFGETGADSLYGEAGSDRLVGGDDDDVLRGGDGDDVLKGDAGNDRLAGEAGVDRLYGAEGNDELSGGTEDDTLFGGLGDDTLYGGSGDDHLLGNEGNDNLFGDEGSDFLSGAIGDDMLRGGDGNDSLNGGEGNDSLRGDGGNDNLVGAEGNDEVRGGDGDDSLRGDSGNDVLRGGAGNDTALGGVGIDLIVGGTGNDTLSGGDDQDEIRGEEGDDIIVGGSGDSYLFGNEGNDTIIGGSGKDVIFGGSGNDTIRGGEGNDLLDGEDGDDQIVGHGGDDILRGGQGNDFLFGGDGNDQLRGHDGNDMLHGDGGADILLGDAGNDLLSGGDGADHLRGDLGSDRLVGGAGADDLRGGEDADLLVGDAGNDSIYGDEGADVLIGGEGLDALEGRQGDDLLVGGIVSHSIPVLDQLLSAWSSADTYEARVQKITDYTFAAHLSPQETVFDDYTPDNVVGGDDRDWFFLPGIVPTYDPLREHNHGDHSHEEDPAGGHQHPLSVVYELPPVEGFDLIDSLDRIVDRQESEVLQTLIAHADDLSKQREHLGLFELVRYDQVTHTAVTSGNWSDPSTWQNGIVPTTGARVLIPIAVNVTVDRVFDTQIFSVRVDGTLAFATDVNTRLRVDTVVVSTSGRLEMGTAAQPIAADVVARLSFTNTGAIDRSVDPFGIGRGLITHGSVSIYGAEVRSFVELAAPVVAGTRILQLAEVPTGWKVGDQIVIAGTTDTQVQDEIRTIQSINGRTVTVAPLTYDHLTPAADLKVHVANVTRNVVLESEASAKTRRGHAMFMHNDDVDIYYAEFLRMGRTDKSIPVNDPVVNENWRLVPGTGTNPRARYSVHFHRAGTLADGDPAVVVGSSVVDSVGWGFVNHSSFVDISGNVSYNVLGAGFVTEVGDETGSFRNNIALSTFSSGDHIEARVNIQDFGHGGDGFWFQGAGITVVDNVAAGSQGNAFVFYTRGFRFGNGERAHYLTANLPDPSLAQGADTLLVDFVPIQEFHGNIGYASAVGLTVEYNLRDATHNFQSIFRDSTFWNNHVGVALPYAHSTLLRNLRIVYDTSHGLGSVGVDMNGQTKSIVYENLAVSGYYRGINVARKGTSLIYGGTFVAQIAFAIRPPTEDDRVVLITGPIAFGELPSDVSPPGLTEVRMLFDLVSVAGSPEYRHLFYNNTVVLNYGSHSMRRVYFHEQSANAIPIPEPHEGVPSGWVGLTTRQLRAFPNGGTIGGQLAPASAVTEPAIVGLLDP